MSGTTPALFAAAAGVGFGHAILPDHWVPLAVLGRARRYPLSKVARLSGLAGVAHVLLSIVLGAVIIAIGLQFRSTIQNAQDTELATVQRIINSRQGDDRAGLVSFARDPQVELNATTNPHGIICNSNEQIVNQVGVDPTTGFPNSTLDNTGVQYGLAALTSGAISPAQFVQLNADIGGLDFTGAPSAQRTDASLKALNAVYADDLYNGVTQGLRTTPVIDAREDVFIELEKNIPRHKSGPGSRAAIDDL